jgi:hypothetical protein
MTYPSQLTFLDTHTRGGRAVAMLEHMPARALFVISALLDYPADPRASIC